MKRIALLCPVAAILAASTGYADARSSRGGSHHRLGHASTAHHSLNWHLKHIFD